MRKFVFCVVPLRNDSLCRTDVLLLSAQPLVAYGSWHGRHMVTNDFYGHNILDNQSDEYRLIIFCSNHGEDRFAEPVTRFVGAVRAQNPDEWKTTTTPLCLYERQKGTHL